MKILHRYVLKEHLGPLTFALTALTSLLLLQYIGKHFGQLVGKGLPARVIVEFFALSVPLTIALTLPMAVLVSTLYAFSRLASENEITALKASGVSLVSVLRPVLIAALGVTMVMVGFNDQILPRSNHRLSILQRDIAQKKPTFGLREQVINEVSPGKLYLRAGHLDEGSNLMREVTIYDMGDPMRRRTIYADSGNMRMNSRMTDLELTLYSGNMQDVPTATPDELQRLYFDVDLIRIRGVGNQFQKTANDSYKSDREMTLCEMRQAQDKARRDYQLARTEFLTKRAKARKDKLPLSKEVIGEKAEQPFDVGLAAAYCGLLGALSVKKAQAQSSTTSSSTPPRLGALGRTRPGVGPAPSLGVPPPVVSADPLATAVMDALRIRLGDSARLMNGYSVEIHKKFALAVACFVFVLLGAPIALRFPRGGVGLTIGVSLLLFSLYYIALIGGETLGKRGQIPPVLSMWMANILFAGVALSLLAGMGKEGATARGGDMRELLDSIRGRFRAALVRIGLASPRRATA
ncbi:MAG TPA: LptF/LptG family permease [Gemmatimonadaceae bacterium]|nr:LptF/LptG family permease [Gemmatimonadaceae bacterium]